MELKRTLKPVDRRNANLEAEKGETVITDLQGDGLPEFFTIDGKAHSKGGTPLNLPEGSFIFSKFNKMKIKDERILDTFGLSKKPGGYTPAEISKKYDINKYLEILMDPDTTKMERHTAEMMIQNNINKLGSLALAQEASKGFENGIPDIAYSYLSNMQISPEMLTGEQQQFKKGGQVLPKYKKGGITKSELPKDNLKIFDNEEKLLEYAHKNPDKLKNYQFFIKEGDTYRSVRLSPSGINHYKPGDEFTVGDTTYKVQDLGEYTDTYYHIANVLLNQPDAIVELYNNYKKQGATMAEAFVNPETGEVDYNMFANAYLSFLKNRFDWNNKNKSKLDELRKEEPGSKSAAGKPLWKINTNKFSQEWIDEYNKEHPDSQINEDYVKEYQRMDAAFADMSKSDVGKNYGFTDGSWASIDPNSLAGTEGNAPLSIIDGKVGDRTLTRLPGIYLTDYVVEDNGFIPEETTAVTPEKKDRQFYKQDLSSEPWYQDQNNLTNAVVDYFTRYNATPYMQQSDYAEYVPAYDDVRGYLAGVASAANSAIAGSPLKADQSRNATNIMAATLPVANAVINGYGSEANRNISIYNNAAQFNNPKLNEYLNETAKARKAYHDAEVIGKQQALNTERALRKNVVDARNRLVTNEAQTYDINQMYDNFDILPGTGGKIAFKQVPGDEVSPNASKSFAQQLKNFKDELVVAGFSDEEVRSIITKNFGDEIKAQVANETNPKVQQELANAISLINGMK